MPSQNAPPAQFWSLMAALRFFFAMWVLFDHTYNFGPADRAMPVFTKSGLVAVMCFFVISGYSIHHSVAERPRGYARRRFWRIFPINALAVGIGWFSWSVLGLSGGYGTPQVPPTAWNFIACLLLLEVFFPVMIDFLFPAWSLSIEAVYYVFAPLLKRLRSDPVVAVLMAVSCAAFVAWPFFSDDYVAGGRSYGATAMVMFWCWLAGWVAYARPRNHLYLAALICGGLAGIYTQAKFFGIVDFTSAVANCAAWVAVLFIVFHRIGGVANERFNAILDYLGEISYPVYLLHYPLLFALTSSVLKAHPEWNYGIMQVGAALAVAVVAYHCVDKPLRALGSFNRNRRKAPIESSLESDLSVRSLIGFHNSK